MKNFFFCLTFMLVASLVPSAAQTTNPQAVVELLNRIGGNGAAEKFVIVVDEGLAANGSDVFVITAQDSKPCIKASNVLAAATGINWYLNHYAHINLAWNNLTIDLAGLSLPLPTAEERRVSTADYRYYFNYCTFSYSMAFWTWERWQQEIDWMALHGINMPLQIVGLEVLWRNILKDSRIGYSDKEIAEFIAGPGFMAWFAMNNLEGWGGTINASDVKMNGNPEWWYERQEQLCKDILVRMREFGMQPALPGFSGMVPNSMSTKNISGINRGDIINSGTWAGGYTRPDIMNPASSSFDYMAKIYYEHLHKLMGVSEFYSMDPFHEGGLPGGVTNSSCYPGVMEALDTYYATVSAEEKSTYSVPEKAKWVIQYWQGLPQQGAFDVMDDKYGDRFIALDLFSDAQGKAKWNSDYFRGCDFIFCMLHNFGGRSGMHGRLQTTMEDYFKALAKSNMKGVGATPEGIETNPILYDMLFELPWMDAKNVPTIDSWIAEYAHARYGIDNVSAVSALQRLKKSVWACQGDQQGTSEAVILARPSWTPDRVSSWSTSAIYWDTQEVLLAAEELLSIDDLITNSDATTNYNYDIIDVVRQSMVDYAYTLLPQINAARNNSAEYERLYNLYLNMMLDLDAMLAYDPNFKLERWTSMARNIADEVGGTTVNDRNWLEWNARTQITVWSKGDTDLHDYSNRCWAGLIKDYHYKRWEYFFKNNGAAPAGGWFTAMEYPWTVNFTDYDYSAVNIPTDVTAAEKTREVFRKYFGKIIGALGARYIFPMGIASNATATDVVPEIYRGQPSALPIETGDGVRLINIWIDTNADLSRSDSELYAVEDGKINVPADAAIGRVKAVALFDDGTNVTFNVAIREEITAARTVSVAASANGTVAIVGCDELTVNSIEPVTIKATADAGYDFFRWVDADGNVVSNDNPYTYYGKAAATFTAEFTVNKWGVPAEDKGDWSDAAVAPQYVNNMTFAYHNREAATVYEASSTPATLFNVVPQIINVPRGASFTLTWGDDDNNALRYCYLSAYIDLNADGDFTDEGELIKTAGTKGAQNSAVCEGAINVLLPYDMPLGLTHARLRFDGAWKNDGYNAQTKAYDAKGTLNRMCYEIILNITEYSSTASHISVATNNSEWGTVSVATDETPSDSKLTEIDVTRGIQFTLTAEASAGAEFLGWFDAYGRLVSSDLVHTMYSVEDAVYTAKFQKYLTIGNWELEYRLDGNSLIFTKVRSGEGDLEIPSEITLGESTYTVVGFDNALFVGNKNLTAITLPAGIQFLGRNELFKGTAIGTVSAGTGTTDTKYYSIFNPAEAIASADGWVATLNGTTDGSTYNQWGSALFATGTNPLAENYSGGLQLYLAKAGNLVMKIGGSTEYSLDNSNCKITAGNSFTVVIKYDGSKVAVSVTNGSGVTGKKEVVAKMNDISAFSAAIPQGVEFDVIVTTLKESNPFAGCSNLDAINIDGESPNYYVDENGDLYNAADELICSPEGKEKGVYRRALGQLIEDTNSLIEQIATIRPYEKNNKIELQTTDASQPNYLWANSVETSEGSIAHLIDGIIGNNSNFFHTNWHNSTTAEGYHFIEVDFGADNSLSSLQFTYYTRTGCTNDFPDAVTIMGSNDKNNYIDVYTVSSGLPQETGKEFVSEKIFFADSYRYLRFKVAAERVYWHMGEFSLSTFSSVADVSTEYASVLTSDEIALCYDAMLAAQGVYNSAVTIQQFQEAYQALSAHYEDILAKVEKVTSVDKLPQSTVEGSGIIYDLSGRRHSTPTKGIYILNGRKIYIRR